MIFGTGLDIIEVDRIKNSIEKFSPKFEERLFTSSEISYCKSQGDPVKHLPHVLLLKKQFQNVLVQVSPEIWVFKIWR